MGRHKRRSRVGLQQVLASFVALEEMIKDKVKTKKS